MALFDDKARVYRIAVTADESDDTLIMTSFTFYRTGQDYEATTNGYTPSGASGPVGTTCLIDIGETLPPPTHIALVATFQA